MAAYADAPGLDSARWNVLRARQWAGKERPHGLVRHCRSTAGRRRGAVDSPIYRQSGERTRQRLRKHVNHRDSHRRAFAGCKDSRSCPTARTIATISRGGAGVSHVPCALSKLGGDRRRPWFCSECHVKRGRTQALSGYPFDLRLTDAPRAIQDLDVAGMKERCTGRWSGTAVAGQINQLVRVYRL